MARYTFSGMLITLVGGLLFVSARVTFQNHELTLDHVLVDTGSVGTVLHSERLFEAGLTFEPTDHVHRVHGIGGSELVVTKTLNRLSLGDDEFVVHDFEVEVGAMDYGIRMDGILGLDCLRHFGLVIDLSTLELRR